MDNVDSKSGMIKADQRPFVDKPDLAISYKLRHHQTNRHKLKQVRRTKLSDIESIIPLRPTQSGRDKGRRTNHSHQPVPIQITFDRHELNTILSVYGRHVAAGNWRDYAIDFGRDRAVFSIFKRASECPVYRVEKDPKLARKQGAFSVTDQSGRILKRGRDLSRVLKVLALKPKLSVV